MLEKNTYYENLKDFVDEQLCAVACKISEKKWLTKQKDEHMWWMDQLESDMLDENSKYENMSTDIVKCKE